jgi:hypothetical protein
MICRACGAKSYNYDLCDQCERPFTKACPRCGAEMGLKAPECPSCGLPLRKFAAVRERRPENDRVWGWLPRPWARRAPYIAAPLLIAVVASIWWAATRRPAVPEPIRHRPGDVVAADSNGDGKPDRWEVWGQNGIVERRLDANFDGSIDRVEYLADDGRVRFVRVDADRDGRVEQTLVLGADGQPRAAYSYTAGNADFPAKIEFYNNEGRVAQAWTDADGDGAWDKFQLLRAGGRAILEGVAGKKGWIDQFAQYREGQKVARRLIDADGDGLIERVEVLNRAGTRIEVDEDADGDGLFERRAFYHLTGKIRWEELDTDADGVPDVFKSYTKDGILARTGADTNNDGNPDHWK